MTKHDESKTRAPGSNRREFLKSAAAATTAAAAGSCKDDALEKKRTASGQGTTPRDPRDDRPAARKPPPRPRKTGRATVVVVRDEQVLDDRGRVRAKVLAKMLDDGVTRLTGAKEVTAAWQALLKPTDELGIKTNVWRHLRTPPALEAALQRRARGVGIAAAHIHVDDRGARKSLARCTALINARPLRSHHWAGIGGCIKNFIPFVERPWEYHPDACADLGALWNLPIVRDKTRLNVLVMLTPLFHGRGPHHFNRKYLWPYKGLILSRDPVAADRVGLEILRARRLAFFKEPRPFAIRTAHVGFADTRHGVGIADLKRIDIVRLGWEQDHLLPG